MTVASSGGPGPPPPIAAPQLSDEAYRGMDRAFTAAGWLRVTLIMNVLALLLSALLSASDGWRAGAGGSELLTFAVFLFLPIVVNAAGIYGTFQMENLRNRPWAIIAVVCGLLPCTGPCCLLSVPVAIWALTGLRRIPYDEWK